MLHQDWCIVPFQSVTSTLSDLRRRISYSPDIFEYTQLLQETPPSPRVNPIESFFMNQDTPEHLSMIDSRCRAAFASNFSLCLGRVRGQSRVATGVP